MKLFQKLAILSLVFFSSSCAMFFNEKNVDVTINSNPQGADIFIEGVNYGQTPKTINIEPKNYNVVLTKEGYGTANLKMDTWVTIRQKGDGKRCLADAVGTMLVIPFYSFYWSGKCLDFKQNEYMVNIPYTQQSYQQQQNNRLRAPRPNHYLQNNYNSNYYYQ